MIDRVGNPGVLGDTLVREIYHSLLIYGNVLQKSVSLDGSVDFRLCVAVQVDDLCVAATLKVENTVIVPTVLVVADKGSSLVCGKGGLAGSGKSEEDSGLALLICIG